VLIVTGSNHPALRFPYIVSTFAVDCSEASTYKPIQIKLFNAFIFQYLPKGIQNC